MQNQPRHYVYKVKHDTGLAPCVEGGLWTLAVCKPRIRARARPGDWVYGFTGNGTGNRLVFAAQVTGVLEAGTYYATRAHAGRKDAIYHWRSGRLAQKAGRSAHKGLDTQRKDIGTAPDHAGARVLLSTTFRYWGDSDKAPSAADLPALRRLLGELRQGHRVNHSAGVHRDLEQLRVTAWKTRRSVCGKPRDVKGVIC